MFASLDAVKVDDFQLHTPFVYAKWLGSQGQRSTSDLAIIARGVPLVELYL